MEGASLTPRRSDILLTGCLAALTQVEVWLQHDVTGLARPATGFVLLAATSSLLWRRTRPLACASAIAAGLALQAAITGADLSSAGWTITIIVALYSAGAYLAFRQATVAFIVIVVGLAARELRDVSSYTRHGYQNAFWWLLVLVPFGLGAFVHSRRQASTLRQAATSSEADAAARARAAVAEERARIARELHDVVAHDVSAVVLQAEAAEEMLTAAPERTRVSLHAIQQLGREALVEMRQVVGIVRGDDTSLAPQPTLGQVAAMVERHRDSGLDVTLQVDGTPRSLPPGLELSAYRIIQEALTNVRKHADGARVQVVVRYGARALEVEIADDGGNETAVADGPGHGLIGMRERVSFFGGQFSAGPGLERGFVVHATVPTPSADGP
jgi:signal transduction histidine kinase